MDDSIRSRACALAIISLSSVFGAALAGDRGPLDQNFQVSLGTFLVTNATQVRLDGQNGVTGSIVDWERDIGLSDANRFRVDGFWRFARRHKIRFMYFDNQRSAMHTLDQDVVFGGMTYPANTSVTAEVGTTIAELAYEYAFLQRDNWELAGSVGIHDIDVTTALAGTISTGGGGASAQGNTEGSTNGPLPVLGFHALWHMGRNFYFDGLVQYFYVSIDDFEGSVTDYKLAATWYPLRNVGIGLGYNDFVTKVDVDKVDFTGMLRISYDGPMIFVTASF
jgi:hypothetical protein